MLEMLEKPEHLELFGRVIVPRAPDIMNAERISQISQGPLLMMTRTGLAVHVPRLRAFGSEIDSRLVKLRSDISSMIGTKIVPEDDSAGIDANETTDASDTSDACEEFNPGSSRQLEALLFDQLGLAKYLGGDKRFITSTGRRATGKAVLERMKGDKDAGPLVQAVLRWKALAKLKSTYVHGIIDHCKMHSKGECSLCGNWHNTNHWRIHSSLQDTVAVTNRLTSSRINQQNIPARSDDGKMIRRQFIAEPVVDVNEMDENYEPNDHIEESALVQRDAAGIELRLIADLSGDKFMCKAFWEGLDIHTLVASEAFGIPMEHVDKTLHRDPAKNLNFGIAYGLTARGLYANIYLAYAVSGKPVPEWLTLSW